MDTTKGRLADAVADQIDRYRDAYHARDVDSMLALFSEEAEVVCAPGVFVGSEAIGKLLRWDVKNSPTAEIRDVGLGVTHVGPGTVVWERVVNLTYDGIPYAEKAVSIVELDDSGLICQFRSYYDKLAVLDQIASGSRGISGWVFKKFIGFIVTSANKGLDS